MQILCLLVKEKVLNYTDDFWNIATHCFEIWYSTIMPNKTMNLEVVETF